MAQGTVSSNDSVGRTRSVLNSGSGCSEDSVELLSCGDEEELLLLETTRSLGEEVLEVLFFSLCLDDFLGGSGELLSLAFWLFVGVGEE